MEKNPATKVSITGYADKETGNPRINKALSEKRANNVAQALKSRGIAADRIVADYKGDTVQPYGVPEENRVSICIVDFPTSHCGYTLFPLIPLFFRGAHIEN